tara:strand:- start:382 stop:633 length:252 start_codon:yes stop_codon:yes gene_type:complete
MSKLMTNKLIKLGFHGAELKKSSADFGKVTAGAIIFSVLDDFGLLPALVAETHPEAGIVCFTALAALVLQLVKNNDGRDWDNS